jgi:hypothetical protein
MIFGKNARISAQSILTDNTLGSFRQYKNSDRWYTGAPTSVSPDKSLILSDKGLIIDATTFEVLGSTKDELVSSVWPSAGFIATLHNPDESNYGFSTLNNWVTPIELTVWDSNYQMLNQITFDAHDAHLIESTNGALLFVDEEGKSKPSVFSLNEMSSDLDNDGIADFEDEFPINASNGSTDQLISSNSESDQEPTVAQANKDSVSNPKTGSWGILGMLLILVYGFFRARTAQSQSNPC